MSVQPGPAQSPEYELLWRLNQRCNYRCEYCFRDGVDDYRSAEHPDCGKYPPEHIAGAFDSTGKRWRIHMTGGEPFLYPGFVELAAALTQNHRISVNTNLSTSNVYTFGEVVPPGRVHSINATVHLEELTRRESGVDGYVDRFLFLQNRGFNIRLMYLTHPSLPDRLVRDVETFRSRGIRNVYLKTFHGRYGDREYPMAFTRNERRLFKEQGAPRRELDIFDMETCFLGRRCDAGHIALDMDLAGNLTRCSSVREDHGNLLEGRYHFDPAPARCPARICRCTYQGMKFAHRSVVLEAAWRLYAWKRRAEEGVRRLPQRGSRSDHPPGI